MLALEIAGVEPGWGVISLTPDRTWSSALALVPPAAFFLATLSLDRSQLQMLIRICIAAAISGTKGG